MNAGDRVAVCISGGKDSFLLAKCIQHLQRVSDVPFEAEYLCMDPGYLPENRALIERNAAALGLPLHIFFHGYLRQCGKRGQKPVLSVRAHAGIFIKMRRPWAATK